MDFEAEIRDLKRRVGDLEGAYNVLASQLRHTNPEFTALRRDAQTRFNDIEQTIARLETSITSVGKRFSGVELQVWSLRDDIPALIGAAVRECVKGPTVSDAAD